MARPLRIEFEDAIYRAYSRGNSRQRIFWDDRDRTRFIELQAEPARRYPIRRRPITAQCARTIQLRKEMLNAET